MQRGSTTILLAGALALGALLGFADTRPGWDDTGITAGALVLACLLFGAARPRLAWLWALAIGGWVPALNILLAHNSSVLLVLVIAFIAAYAGALIRRMVGGAVPAP